MTTKMTADYAIPLKKAWGACPCRRGEDAGANCGFCLCSRQVYPLTNGKNPCKWPVHAALLEMVDAFHVTHCWCNKDPKMDGTWEGIDGHCVAERRRLRAAVGVEVPK